MQARIKCDFPAWMKSEHKESLDSVSESEDWATSKSIAKCKTLFPERNLEKQNGKDYSSEHRPQNWFLEPHEELLVGSKKRITFTSGIDEKDVLPNLEAVLLCIPRNISLLMSGRYCCMVFAFIL
ncbi:hypothetical protein C0J52_27076 [Blattella germanica]|nr:hypothetical protein C0J52_27076 [Blattella germanica]